NQGAPAVRLFEIGAAFRDRGPGLLPEESPMMCAVVCGSRLGHAHDAAQQAVEVADPKGLWEAGLGGMGVDTPKRAAYSSPGWKPGASAEVASATSRIGWAGTLGQELLQLWGIEADVHLFTVRLDALPERSGPTVTRQPGRFPPARRDVAFFVPDSVTHQ